MWDDFKKFAMSGNVVDLAIGVIIGGAFGKIVSSLVSDIIMPLISFLTSKIFGNMDMTNNFISLDGSNYKLLAEAAENGAITLNYGMFISVLIDFFFIAFTIFIVIRQINKLKPEVEEEEEEVTTRECPYCLSEVPLEATRCAFCTSELEPVELEADPA